MYAAFSMLVLALALCAAGLTAFVQLAPESATHLAIQIERARSGLTQKHVQLPNGLTFNYLEGGSGEPLVLLHGFTANKDNFTRIAVDLTPHYHVIIPDLIGFGESSHPTHVDYQLAGQATLVHQFLSKLQIAKMHMGGSSMGGAIAVIYAEKYPTDVKSLWLLDPAGVTSAPKTEFFKTYASTGKNALIIQKPEEYDRVYETTMNQPPYIPKSMLHVMAKENIANAELASHIFKQFAYESIEAAAKAVQIPTLIVWGDKDRLLHVKSAEILHQWMPQSKVIVMKNIGHLPMLESVEQTANDYLSFRDSLSQP